MLYFIPKSGERGTGETCECLNKVYATVVFKTNIVISPECNNTNIIICSVDPATVTTVT